MANTNRKNPIAAAEPAHQSRQAAGKHPTHDSPALRYRRYDRGGPKDPPESLVGTSTRTKAKRKSLSERKGACPVIKQTNADPPVVPATLDSKEVVALPPPIVPTVGQESTADTPANIEDATVQLPWIVPQSPPIGEPSPKATMPTLLCLPASGITPAENRCYPKQSNWSPYFTPPKVINACSLGKGHEMTPLDVCSPDGATLEQVLYAEKKMFGDDNDSHKLSDLDIDLKDGDYRDPGDDEADDDSSQSSAMGSGGKGTGGKMQQYCY
jgi:hypothetical protein